MKKILMLLFIWASFYTQAQFWGKKISGNGEVTTVSRQIGNFDKITVTGAFKVKIVAGKTGRLVLTADQNLLEIIETYTKGSKLIIRINPDFNLQHYTKLQVEVPTDYLSQITLTGSGSVYNEKAFSWHNLKLTLTGSGTMDFKTSVAHIKVSLTGSGDIYLSGKADDADYVLTGSGDLKAQDLTVQDVTATVIGSGDLDLKAVHRLNAKILGSGDIYYFGEPQYLKTKTLGSGDVNYKRQ